MKYLIIFLLCLFSLDASAQTCFGASGISSTDITHQSADINFTANEDVLNYVIVYYINPLTKFRSNVNDPGGPYPASISPPINGLTPSTTYSYYIVTNCNSGDSVLSSVFSFTTIAAPCEAVTGNNVSAITSTSAYIYATAYLYATSYTLKYVKQGNIDTVTVGPSVNPTWQLSNLLGNTTYAYRIYSTCPSGTNSVAGTFTTLQLAVSYTPMTGFGYRYKRSGNDSTHDIPQGPTPDIRNGDRTRANIFYDSLAKVFYVWDAPEQEWHSVTGCTTTLNAESDSTSGPVTGETTYTPLIDGVPVLLERELLLFVRNSIPAVLDVDYTFDQSTGTITVTDAFEALETFAVYYSCGSSGATETGAISSVPQEFTDGATVTIDYNLTKNWYGTIQGNRTFAITNMPNGAYITIKVIQGTGGNKQPTFPTGGKQIASQGSGVTPPHSATAGQFDIYTGYKDETGNINWTSGVNYQ